MQNKAALKTNVSKDFSAVFAQKRKQDRKVVSGAAGNQEFKEEKRCSMVLHK